MAHAHFASQPRHSEIFPILGGLADNGGEHHGSHSRSLTGKRIIRALVGLAVVIFVFGWLLPQVIDYELIWEAISGLTWGDLILLTALSLLRVPTEARSIFSKARRSAPNSSPANWINQPTKNQVVLGTKRRNGQDQTSDQRPLSWRSTRSFASPQAVQSRPIHDSKAIEILSSKI